jgi:hypothetical protein
MDYPCLKGNCRNLSPIKQQMELEGMIRSVFSEKKTPLRLNAGACDTLFMGIRLVNQQNRTLP